MVRNHQKIYEFAQIEEREIKERTAKEIRGKIAKVVEEELEKKNSLEIHRRFKKEMKEEGLQRKS